MATYKVSYKVLRQQGDELKAIAKMVDGYAERVGQINGKLGSDNMLAEIRSTLNKLKAQLGESRVVLNTAGELLIKTIDGYGGVEIRQVKKVDGMKAHNRDFYKKPVAVASAGGAVAGAAAGAAGSSGAASASAVSNTTTTTTTTNNTVNTTNNAAVPAASSAQAQPAAAPAASPAQAEQTAAPVESVSQPVEQVLSEQSGAARLSAQREPAVTPVAAAQPESGGMSSVAKAGIAAGAAAVTAGAVAGGVKLKKKADAKKAAVSDDDETDDEYSPEAELEKAIKRVAELEEEENN